MPSELRNGFAKSRKIDSGIYEETDDFDEECRSFPLLEGNERNSALSEEQLTIKSTYQVVPPRIYRQDSCRTNCGAPVLKHEQIFTDLFYSEDLHLKVLTQIKNIQEAKKEFYAEDVIHAIFGELDGLISFHSNFRNGLSSCKTMNDLGRLITKMESDFNVFIIDKWMKSKYTAKLPYIFIPYSDWGGSRLKTYNDMLRNLVVNRVLRLKPAQNVVSNIVTQYNIIDFLAEVKSFPEMEYAGKFKLKDDFRLRINDVTYEGTCTVLLMEKCLLFILPDTQECFASIEIKFVELCHSESETMLIINDLDSKNVIILSSDTTQQTTLWVIALKQLTNKFETNSKQEVQVLENSEELVPGSILSKSEHIVNELITTEKNFIAKMDFVKNNYLYKLSNEVSDKQSAEEHKLVFLNWEQIQNAANKFIVALEKCGYNYELIGQCFLDAEEDLFEKYRFYLMNQPAAKHYLSADNNVHHRVKIIQADINDALGLQNHLLIPMQRMTRYPLLLESLLNSLDSHENYPKLRGAIDMIKRITDDSNSYIAASSITNLPFELKHQGKFIRKDTFDSIEGRHAIIWRNIEVFLFEKVIIFAAIEGENNYLHKESIYLEHLALQVNEELILVDYMRNKVYNSDKYKYILTNRNPVIVSKWRKEIESQLWLQMASIKEKTIRRSKTRMPK